jgi:hypothetical protein
MLDPDPDPDTDEMNADPQPWPPRDRERKMAEYHVLQTDIEAHGRIVKLVLGRVGKNPGLKKKKPAQWGFFFFFYFFGFFWVFMVF